MKFSELSISRISLGALLALAPMAQGFGNAYIWNGTNTNLDTAGAWNPSGPPATGDVAIFNDTGLSDTTPQVNGSQAIGTIQFQQTTAYNIGWSTTNTLTLDTSGVNNGSILSSGNQTFTINQGRLLFSNSASADYTATGTIKYIADSGELNFRNTSTASNADITANNGGSVDFDDSSVAATSKIVASSTTGSTLVVFSENAKTQKATITANDSPTRVTFYDSSIAGDTTSGNVTTITLNDGSKLSFLESSDANQATINGNDTSEIILNTTTSSTQNGPTVTLADTSKLTVTQTNLIGQLISSDSGTSVDLAANQNLTTFQPGSTSNVYAGQITGDNTSTFIKSGANDPTGSLELTGTIATVSNDWELQVDNGTLIGNAGNINRLILINGNGNCEFKQSADGTYNEVISGSGTLIKSGTAKLTIDALSNNSGFTGDTQINAGNLVLNGQLGGDIAVNSTGTISGTGIANGTVTVNNGGTIAPGNSIGTLTVGDYTSNIGSTYNVELNGSSTAAVDLIHATQTGTTGNGTATLNGGDVNVTSTDGTFLIDLPYTIVTADDGLTGEYDSAGPNPVGFNQYLVPNLSYDANNAFLTLNTNFSAFAETTNQEHVAQQLDSITNPSEDLEDVLQNLVTLDPSDLNDALDQLSGQQYTSLFQITQLNTRHFLRDLTTPFRLKQLRACDCDCDPCDCDIEIWEDIHYGRAFLDGDHQADGYRLRNIDAAIGAQIDFDNCWTAGIAAYYENDHVDYKLGGRARVNTVIGALYANYQNECYYLNSDLLFGYSHWNMKRKIEFADIDRKTHAHPKVYDVTFYTEAGSNVYEGCYGVLQPFLGLEFGWYRHNSFDEEGADSINLDVKSKHSWNFNSRLGLRASSTLGSDFIVSADVAWQHRYTSNDATVKVRFDEFGDTFSIRGPKQKRNGIDGSVLLGYKVCGDLILYAQAMGERWERFSNYTFVLGIDFKL